MADIGHDQPRRIRHAVERTIDTVGWGLFFVWVGIALLAEVGWGAGLLGVGLIALGTQLARLYAGLPIERVWLLTAILFIVAGAWELLKVGLGQAPLPGGLLSILSIVIGVALIVSVFFRRQKG